MKRIEAVLAAPPPHWVGDGFPVRSLFSYQQHGASVSPFLLLDYAAPARFDPGQRRRGVGAHPHRGFETVTIVYDGEVSHRDSSGGGGTIRPGDVQWMTAGSGIVHDEFHSDRFTETGGRIEMAQLWVNLPAKHKMAPPRYQNLARESIPVVPLAGDGRLRVIAGAFGDSKGPAVTFTPIDLWDITLPPDARFHVPAAEGYRLVLVLLEGAATINDSLALDDVAAVVLGTAGEGATVATTAKPMPDAPASGPTGGKTRLLVMSGEPIDEPLAGYGPFVMNTDAEIREAIMDFNSGRFGELPAPAKGEKR